MPYGTSIIEHPQYRQEQEQMNKRAASRLKFLEQTLDDNLIESNIDKAAVLIETAKGLGLHPSDMMRVQRRDGEYWLVMPRPVAVWMSESLLSAANSVDESEQVHFLLGRIEEGWIWQTIRRVSEWVCEMWRRP